MDVAAESITGQSPVCSSCLEPPVNVRIRWNVTYLDTLCPFFLFFKPPWRWQITAHVYQPKQLVLHLSVFHSKGEECCFSCFSFFRAPHIYQSQMILLLQTVVLSKQHVVHCKILYSLLLDVLLTHVINSAPIKYFVTQMSCWCRASYTSVFCKRGYSQ